MVSKEQILKKGSVEVHVKVGGIRQRHTLKVEKEKTAWGMVPFLVFSRQVSAAELVRIAQELQLPVKCKGMKVFPKGKAAQDFAEKDPVKRKGLAHDRVLGSKSTVSGSESRVSEEEEKDEEPEEESEGEVEEEQKTEDETEEESEEGEVADPEESEGEEREEEEQEESEPEIEGKEGSEKQEQEIEIEGSGNQKQKADPDQSSEEKPKKKIFSGVLSEGILS